MTLKLLHLNVHLQKFNNKKFITDLNAALNDYISQIDIETALNALETLDSILLNDECLKKIKEYPAYQIQIPQFHSKLKQHIVNTRAQISRRLFLGIPDNELNTLNPQKDVYTKKMTKDFNDFSNSLLLYIIKDMSYEKAILKINHLIDMLGMAIDQKNFHDVWAISATLNNGLVQTLIKKYSFSKSREAILQRMSILEDDYDEFMNLRHAMFDTAIPPLSIYGGQAAKNKLMSGESESLFKPVLSGLQEKNKALLTKKDVASYPPSDFNKLTAIKKLMMDAGGWQNIANQIDMLSLDDELKESAKTALKEIGTDYIVQNMEKIDDDLTAAQIKYDAECKMLLDSGAGKSIDEMKIEPGLDEYEKAYNKIGETYNSMMSSFRYQIEKNPGDKGLRATLEALTQIKEQDINDLDASVGVNAPRFQRILRVRSLESKIRELHNDKTSSKDNLDQTLNESISAIALLSRHHHKKRFFKSDEQHQHIYRIIKLLNLENAPNNRQHHINYERAIGTLHHLSRVNYAAESQTKILRSIEKLVMAFGDSTENRKLGGRQELKSVLARLIAEDQTAVELINKTLGMQLTLTPTLIKKLVKLNELVTAQDTLKELLRNLEFQLTVKGKLQYLDKLQQTEFKSDEDVGMLVDSLKNNLGAMNPKKLVVTCSYKTMGYNRDGFFAHELSDTSVGYHHTNQNSLSC